MTIQEAQCGAMPPLIVQAAIARQAEIDASGSRLSLLINELLCNVNKQRAILEEAQLILSSAQ
ncbi:MAG: hypothetical protein WC485_00415 [Opitutaceae bacterium]